MTTRAITGHLVGTSMLLASWASLLPAQTVPSPDPLAPLRFLVGSCWRGSFPDGKSVDTHCYEDVYEGKFIRDRHLVRGEDPDYRGETIYHWDREAGRIRYRYWSSAGGVSDGGVELLGSRILFPGERHVGEDGSVVEMRTVMEKRGNRAYRSTTEQKTSDGWTELWTIEFERLGSSSIDAAQILFTGKRGETAELYRMNRAIDEVTRVSFAETEGARANAGRISPDGRWVAFQQRRGTDYEIHVMDLASGETRNVTRHPEYDVSPVWSPDGRRLAFMSTRGFELGSIGPFPGHVYVLDLEDAGAAPRPITQEPLTSSFGPSDWSPDGTGLLIARVTSGRPDLFLLDVTTRVEARVTDTPEGEYSAVFSHDGRLIASHAETDDASQIVVMNLDGSGRRTLTTGPGWRYYPRFSPDDRWIVFTASDDGEQYDVRAVEIESGTAVDLVATPEDEREGSWFPSR